MATANLRYTLAGFSTELDWRPLRFVEPIPPVRKCGACGLVRPVTAYFPCQHILCESCYEQSAHRNVRVCPLDGHRCLDKDVGLQEVASDVLQRIEVRCWNEQAGCKVTMAATDLSDHFHNDCRHHSTLCPKCSASILCSDVHAHLITGCSATVLSASNSDHRRPENRSEAMGLASSIELLDQRMADIKAGLERILNSNKTYNQTMSEVRNSIETMKKGMWNEFAETSRRSHDGFVRSSTNLMASAVKTEAKEYFAAPNTAQGGVSDRINEPEETLWQEIKSVLCRARSDGEENATRIDSMHSELMEASREALDRLGLVMAQTSLERSVYGLTVQSVGYLQDIAARDGSAEFLNDRVYLRGYCMSPGVRLVEHGDTVSLHALIFLHRGENDDSLDWPLKMAVRFSAVHPVTGAELLDRVIHPACELVSMPGVSQAEPRLRALPPSFLLSDLQRDGFVRDDCLLLRYELIRRRRLT